jgi:hypothetical protein
MVLHWSNIGKLLLHCFKLMDLIVFHVKLVFKLLDIFYELDHLGGCQVRLLFYYFIHASLSFDVLCLLAELKGV